MKKLFFLSSLLISVIHFGQNFIQAYQERANQVTQTNITTYLQQFENLGVKTTGSVANANALNWLKNKYLSFGYTSSQLFEHSWSAGGYNSKNLVVTKTGTTYPNKYVIICGHFDTVVGPGTNDNGSGVSVILEIARILKDVPTEYSIRFINFSGEEQGLYGSSRYVSEIVNGTNPKMDIKVVFNIDEVGGVAGMTNDTIYCDRDESSPNSNNAASNLMAQQLATCTTLYSPLLTDFDPAYASDYVPFQQNGEIITGFYEHNISNYPHGPNDKLINMDPIYVYNVAKAAVGAAQHFATASTTNLAATDCPPEKMFESLRIFPNPASDIVHIEMLNKETRDFTFTVTDYSGKLISKTKNEYLVDVSKLKPGIYLGVMEVDGKTTTKKIVVK